VKYLLYLGCPPSERAETQRALAATDVSVVWADTVGEVLHELHRRDIPVLIDLSRGGSALNAARDLRERRPRTLMFAVVDPRRPELTTEAVLAGMVDVFSRPLGGKRVASAIERELRDDAAQSPRRAKGGEMYAHSPAMRDVMAIVGRAASMRAGVIICGERGTGRRATARAIHAAQGGLGAFVSVDCSLYEQDDLESHLFGSAARTPNERNGRGIERVSRNGLLHDARGGTLYLQNLTDAPARAQARLARLLRDREATIAETSQDVDFDVRPMAGVEPPFEAIVGEGRVREDLFRRLSLIRIDMPPLRNRREDVPALANYFLREVCAALGLPAKTFSRPALALISALPWRGNAAELRGLIDALVSSSNGGPIGLDDVLTHVKLDGGPLVFSNNGTLRQARARFEREYIAATLERHHGRISDAAKALGIQRTNLYRKMRSLRVSRARV